jgi:hypothetical protein
MQLCFSGERLATGCWFRVSQTSESEGSCAIEFLAIIIGSIPLVVHFGIDLGQKNLIFISLPSSRGCAL